MYYALAKEFEDLEQWQEAFKYYKLGGDAAAGVARVAGYDVGADIAVIDRIIEVCSVDWLADRAGTGRAMDKNAHFYRRSPPNRYDID